MNMIEATALARHHMEKHGLDDWRVEFDMKRRTLGSCNHSKKVITLSQVYLANNQPDIILNTILHEIAHALCPASEGHGRVWKAKARALGCVPSPYQRNSVMPRKFTGTCPGCGKTYQRNMRLPMSCGRCSPRNFNPQYQLTWQRN